MENWIGSSVNPVHNCSQYKNILSLLSLLDQGQARNEVVSFCVVCLDTRYYEWISPAVILMLLYGVIDAP